MMMMMIIDVAAAIPDEINRRASIALIRMRQDGPGTTLIGATLAAYNIHQQQCIKKASVLSSVISTFWT